MLAANVLAFDLFGIKLVGFNYANGKKLLLTLGIIVAAIVAGRLLKGLLHILPGGLKNERVKFWTRQAINILVALLVIVGFVSVWFDDPGRLGTFMGLVTAGIAFALQKVITAFAGYLLILRGKTFNVGDRITMGGVRGDVIALGFLQTTIMEMGQPPSVQNADPAMWVKSRQYTGRIVTVTNDKVFDQPVYNYTRDFPYIWEEITLPISYKDDWRRAEQILLDAAKEHTVELSAMSADDIKEMQRRYVMRQSELHPKVYLRMTDNWVELTVRFICRESGVRDLKDRMNRQILGALEDAGIGVASTTFELVGIPPLRVERMRKDK